MINIKRMGILALALILAGILYVLCQKLGLPDFLTRVLAALTCLGLYLFLADRLLEQK
ncbi:hypothetical protein ACX3VT_02235 [Aerococcus sanguinicola]|uniref:hypothetical protein n=1 Tax=unclassified Aerococcus TaxID=2618060 RepID=UPI000A5D12C3|nr:MULTISPECIES: hypothetical protein [unclassified Aerococcus]MDK6233945.1 hypothetical protein [Aerococcus sp. UMB10185]MDK6805716.1 hypothetical protein [Aerococcus sp. UMB7834]MDK6856338.1 hypothetical protein [Aerococcus sp. UMB7533]MDK8502691.1 hypothetical protein [Aerococcus sp. UMB1112A]